MAITTDDILAGGSAYMKVAPTVNRPQSPIPPIDASLAGAPPTIPGSGVSSQQTSTPAPQASAAGAAKTLVTHQGNEGGVPYTANGKKMTYVDLVQKLSPYRPPTTEELEQERKKQKRDSIFAAISDGISALSNLYYTTQYAPNSYDPSKGMTAATKKRFDQLKREREENQRQYMAAYMQAMRLDAEDADKERSWRHTLERERIADDRAKKKEEQDEQKARRDELMFQIRYALQLGRLTEQGYRNAVAEVKADKIDELTDAQIAKYNRMGSGGSGKVPEYPWYDSEGNLHYASSYEAMRQNAINHGTWSEATQQSVTEREQKDRRGKTKGTTSSITTKPAKGHSEKPAKPQQPATGKKKTNVEWK